MLALCKKEQKDHLQRLFEIIDITKVRSLDLLENIFGYLGKFSLDSVAKKFLWELRENGKGACVYVSSKSLCNMFFSNICR